MYSAYKTLRQTADYCIQLDELKISHNQSFLDADVEIDADNCICSVDLYTIYVEVRADKYRAIDCRKLSEKNKNRILSALTDDIIYERHDELCYNAKCDREEARYEMESNYVI